MSYAGDHYILDTGLVNSYIYPWVVSSLSHEEDKTKCKNYKFHSLNVADIDFYAIADDLSKSNPIALVHVQGEDDDPAFCVVHHTLMKKAESVGINPPFLHDLTISTFDFDVFDIYGMDSASLWIEWAKSVKNAQWPTRNKATVKVSLPTI